MDGICVYIDSELLIFVYTHPSLTTPLSIFAHLCLNMHVHIISLLVRYRVLGIAIFGVYTALPPFFVPSHFPLPFPFLSIYSKIYQAKLKKKKKKKKKKACPPSLYEQARKGWQKREEKGRRAKGRNLQSTHPLPNLKSRRAPILQHREPRKKKHQQE